LDRQFKFHKGSQLFIAKHNKASSAVHALRRTAQCDSIGLMKRTFSVVAAAILISMMALMFLGGLLKKAARVVDDQVRNGSD